MNIFKYIICFPICLVFGIIVDIFATLLLPIYIICRLIYYCIKKTTKFDINNNKILAFEEFIFICYGFGMMLIILPFEI